MSGGSHNYAYSRLNAFIDDVRGGINGEATLPRMMFCDHLEKVARAMRAIEWVDSGDSICGSEDDAISACIGGDGK